MRQKISNMATDIWTAHLMTYQSAEMIDGGGDTLNQASMAQYLFSEAACKDGWRRDKHLWRVQ